MDERALRPFRVMAVASAVLGTTALGLSYLAAPPPMHIALAVLVLAVVVAENAAVVQSGYFSASLSFPLSIAAIILFGPTAGGLVVASASISVSEFKQRTSPDLIAFNLGQLLLTMVLSGWLYLWSGGRVLLTAGGDWQPLSHYYSDFPAVLLPLLVLGFSSAVLNAALLGIGFAVRYDSSFWSFLRRNRLLFAVQLSLTTLAVSIAQVMAVQVAGLFLFVFPLLVARQVYERYLALKSSYVDAVRSLVAALEAKDPYTAGHSERVASYAVTIAKSMRLPEDVLERIDLAAQVHDLGKVGLPSSVLAKPGRLTAEEFDLVRRHPEVGAEIVERVPDLAHIVPIVRYHHERFDGGGYCTGLAGTEIPIEARIMAVADSFDAMTSSRAYRPAMTLEDALKELDTCSGTQFDPEIAMHLRAHYGSAEQGISEEGSL